MPAAAGSFPHKSHSCALLFISDHEFIDPKQGHGALTFLLNGKTPEGKPFGTERLETRSPSCHARVDGFPNLRYTLSVHAAGHSRAAYRRKYHTSARSCATMDYATAHFA